ncbi:MAG: fibronectin type III domain-containing protein [Alistipes senegalensis]
MKKLLFALSGLLFSLAAAAQDFKITHGPYLCDMTRDGVTVVWTTSKPALSWVEVAPDDGRSFYAQEHTRYYQTVAGRKLADRTLHAVRIKGLKPGTDYCYRIFSQEVTAWPQRGKASYGRVAASDVFRRKPYPFRTFPDSGADCSFIVFNDIHGRADYMAELCKKIDFSELGFVVFNGDMSSSVESEEQLFADYVDTSAALFASGTPILFNRGNHETRGVWSDRLIDCFPTRSGEFYGIYRYGDVCLLVLDCGEDKPDSDVEYYGLADYDAYRAKECEWLKRAVQSEEFLGIGADRPVACASDDGHLARKPPSQRALHAGAERGGHRPDALRPRTPLFVPSRRGAGRTVPDRDQRQQELRSLRRFGQSDPGADHRSQGQGRPHARISVEHSGGRSRIVRINVPKRKRAGDVPRPFVVGSVRYLVMRKLLSQNC